MTKNELARLFAERVLGWPFEQLFTDKKDKIARLNHSLYSPDWNTPTQSELLEEAESFLKEFSVERKAMSTNPQSRISASISYNNRRKKCRQMGC